MQDSVDLGHYLSGKAQRRIANPSGLQFWSGPCRRPKADPGHPPYAHRNHCSRSRVAPRPTATAASVRCDPQDDKRAAAWAVIWLGGISGGAEVVRRWAHRRRWIPPPYHFPSNVAAAAVCTGGDGGRRLMGSQWWLHPPSSALSLLCERCFMGDPYRSRSSLDATVCTTKDCSQPQPPPGPIQLAAVVFLSQPACPRE
jgi:hypothetical protein